MPGNCTTMRVSPCWVICGSTTPVSSMRRRTISIDCCTAPRARAFSATGDSVSMIVPSGLEATIEFRRPGRALRRDQRADRRHRRIQLGGIAQFQQDAVLIGLRLQRLVEDRSRPQRLAHGVDHAVQPLLDHRLHVDLEQQVGPAAQVEAEMHLPPRQPGRRGGEQVGDAEDSARAGRGRG